MNLETGIKTGTAALGSFIIHFTESFSTGIIFLLVTFVLLDYITGITVAGIKREISSRAAFNGFLKKMLYFVMVGVAFGIDYLLSYAILHFNIIYDLPAFFGVLSVFYLISTEAISILENLGEIGIEVPFLSKTLKKIRRKTGEKAS